LTPLLDVVLGHLGATMDVVTDIGTDNKFPEEDLLPSPAGWTPPPRCRPGWNWVPAGGATPRPDLMPRWLVMHRIPILDRRADRLMWERGGFLVLPPGHAWLKR
jgi:hypothetical protein